MREKSSLAELLAEKAQIEKRIAAAEKHEAQVVIQRIRTALVHYNITAAMLGYNTSGVLKKTISKPKIVKVSPLRGYKRPVKYSDGNGNTWAGGGYKPLWLREELNKGRALDEFLVQQKAA